MRRKLSLSRDQIQDINSFLDDELASIHNSVKNSYSIGGGSINPPKNKSTAGSVDVGRLGHLKHPQENSNPPLYPSEYSQNAQKVEKSGKLHIEENRSKVNPEASQGDQELQEEVLTKDISISYSNSTPSKRNHPNFQIETEDKKTLTKLQKMETQVQNLELKMNSIAKSEDLTQMKVKGVNLFPERNFKSNTITLRNCPEPMKMSQFNQLGQQAAPFIFYNSHLAQNSKNGFSGSEAFDGVTPQPKGLQRIEDKINELQNIIIGEKVKKKSSKKSKRGKSRIYQNNRFGDYETSRLISRDQSSSQSKPKTGQNRPKTSNRKSRLRDQGQENMMLPTHFRNQNHHKSTQNPHITNPHPPRRQNKSLSREPSFQKNTTKKSNSKSGSRINTQNSRRRGNLGYPNHLTQPSNPKKSRLVTTTTSAEETGNTANNRRKRRKKIEASYIKKHSDYKDALIRELTEKLEKVVAKNKKQKIKIVKLKKEIRRLERENLNQKNQGGDLEKVLHNFNCLKIQYEQGERLRKEQDIVIKGLNAQVRKMVESGQKKALGSLKVVGGVGVAATGSSVLGSGGGVKKKKNKKGLRKTKSRLFV